MWIFVTTSFTILHLTGLKAAQCRDCPFIRCWILSMRNSAWYLVRLDSYLFIRWEIIITNC